jgi:predicted metal-dependent HD superfamily phosphohydrolase
MHDYLAQHWQRWWKDVGATGDVDQVFHIIATRYSEPHRAYHTLAHLEHCFREFDQSKHLAYHRLTLELALWLHDVIYDPQSSRNEDESAKLARELCRVMGLGDNFGKLVVQLILATKHTNQPVYRRNAQLLLDIDLAILGQPPERFWEYERQIRQEYAWVPETAYREGRKRVLEGFLKRRLIYRTWSFQERYEDQARDNLTESIRTLG